ncbi:hypothetical protein ASPZODRAFT_1318887 [Penicilliopsis zonata CBS 506.65]|uniref:Thioredoxin domain-containing protein n=1 Tax=Penicilliopsis zonata CBS 506.65 TaxID=1073090 RepID=A0A1L9SNF8_9EURO|nr:hypothetical protein ASPZODRAFT_1318887 [Penicilliopsis zonata CBS 506.65]OJJ48789.1 hypothetical protein ASPZODRAFT_1318887 [Penicilliopsis zonata CBS 506.65]
MADLDDEALFAELEKEDDSAYRAQRLEQLNAEFASTTSTSTGSKNVTTLESTHYPTLSNDQALLDFTTQTHKCVVHFAHPDFARCTVMDENLRTLATLHHEVRFVRVDVRNTPFVVEKLNVRVLPYLIAFKDGLAVERVVGFEGLGAGTGEKDGGDSFSVKTLERRLLHRGILLKARLDDSHDGGADSDAGESGREDAPRRGLRQGFKKSRNHDDDDDDDWD